MSALTYSTPNAFGQEGTDHLNISSQSTLQLGLLLDPSYLKVIDYPHIGKFASVLNLWYWLKTEPLDDSLRRLTGNKLKQKVLTLNSQNKVPHFKAIIATATYLKLQQYPHCLKQLRNLPEGIELVSYYVPKGTGIRMCSNYAPLIREIALCVQQLARAGLPAEFTGLAERGYPIGYHYLEPFLVHHFGKDALDQFHEV